jgi:hypothetical protein
MKRRDIFGLLVRIAGLVSLLYMLKTALLFFGPRMHWVFIVKTIVWLALTLWLLRGAPQLVRFAYPDDKDKG